MRRLALRSVLSSMVAEEQLLVLEGLEIAAPRTKEVVALLDTLGVDGKAMIVLPGDGSRRCSGQPGTSHSC